jgi:hypothetical protein
MITVIATNASHTRPWKKPAKAFPTLLGATIQK